MGGLGTATWVIVVAAGHSRRMGTPDNKIWLEFGDHTVLAWSLKRLSQIALDGGVVVARSDEVERVAGMLEPFRGFEVAVGGAERYLSVRSGLQALESRAGPRDVVLVHDAARCLVPRDLLERVVEMTQQEGTAIPVTPVADTVKTLRGTEITGTLPRDGLGLSQTPQGFRFGWLMDAYRHWAGGVPTDDAEVLERAGYRVRTVNGDPTNAKLTTPQDRTFFEWMVSRIDDHVAGGTGL